VEEISCSCILSVVLFLLLVVSLLLLSVLWVEFPFGAAGLDALKIMKSRVSKQILLSGKIIITKQILLMG
jgi:hypothetical protein